MTEPEAGMGRIIRPEPAPIRAVWPGEATHFTPWLAANLDWLEGLGLGPLELEGVETPIPGVWRNLDILARTVDGRRVAIENQYHKADHDHLTRGMAYALGLQAKALVVIAEDHGAEFIAIADYLNSAFEQLGDDDGVAVFLVKVAVERVGDAFVPRFDVLARPNSWLSAVHAEEAIGRPTVSGFLQGVPTEIREWADRIVKEWISRPDGSVRVSPKLVSVSLDYPYGWDTTPRSLFVLYASGVLTVNRGYLIESGRFQEAEQSRLDAAIRGHFPAVSDKPYYPSVAAPAPEQVASFGGLAGERLRATGQLSGHGKNGASGRASVASAGACLVLRVSSGRTRWAAARCRGWCNSNLCPPVSPTKVSLSFSTV